MAAPLLRRLCNLVVPTTSYPSMYYFVTVPNACEIVRGDTI